MAVFKVVDKVYVSEDDLKRLISYVCQKASHVGSYNMIMTNTDVIANQILYIQKCYGGELRTRALHYVLSFDDKSWEHWMKADKIQECTFLFALYERFKYHQHFCAIHKDSSCTHIHFIINPVNNSTLKIWHCSIVEWERMMKDLAGELYSRYKLALQSVSYIDEKGNLKLGNEISPFLYMDRDYSYDKLK